MAPASRCCHAAQGLCSRSSRWPPQAGCWPWLRARSARRFPASCRRENRTGLQLPRPAFFLLTGGCEPSEPSHRKAWKPLKQLVIGRSDVGIKNVSAFQQHHFVVSTEPIESAVERQGMSFAMEAQPAQEQHHPRVGGEPQLLSGLQPLLLAICKSPSPVEGFGINAQRDQWQLGVLRGWQSLLEASFQAFVHAGHCLLHHVEGQIGRCR